MKEGMPLLSPSYEESSSIVSSSRELTLLDAIDRILDKGMVINGDITIAIGGTDLLSLKINLVIASLETAKKYGLELPWEKWQRQEMPNLEQDTRNSLRNGNGDRRSITTIPGNGKKARNHK